MTRTRINAFWLTALSAASIGISPSVSQGAPRSGAAPARLDPDHPTRIYFFKATDEAAAFPLAQLAVYPGAIVIRYLNRPLDIPVTARSSVEFGAGAIKANATDAVLKAGLPREKALSIYSEKTVTEQDGKSVDGPSYQAFAFGSLQMLVIDVRKTLPGKSATATDSQLISLRQVDQLTFQQAAQSLAPRLESLEIDRMGATPAALEAFFGLHLAQLQAMVADNQAQDSSFLLPGWRLPVFGKPPPPANDGKQLDSDPLPYVKIGKPTDLKKLARLAQIACANPGDCPEFVGLLIGRDMDNAYQCTTNYFHAGGWFSTNVHCIPPQLRNPSGSRSCAGEIYVKMPKTSPDDDDLVLDCDQIEYLSPYETDLTRAPDLASIPPAPGTDLAYFRVKADAALAKRTTLPIDWRAIPKVGEPVHLFAVNPILDQEGLNGVIERKTCRVQDPLSLQKTFPLTTNSGYPVVFYGDCDVWTVGGNSGSAVIGATGKAFALHSTHVTSGGQSLYSFGTAYSCFAPTDYEGGAANVDPKSCPLIDGEGLAIASQAKDNGRLKTQIDVMRWVNRGMVYFTQRFATWLQNARDQNDAQKRTMQEKLVGVIARLLGALATAQNDSLSAQAKSFAAKLVEYATVDVLNQSKAALVVQLKDARPEAKVEPDLKTPESSYIDAMVYMTFHMTVDLCSRDPLLWGSAYRTASELWVTHLGYVKVIPAGPIRFQLHLGSLQSDGVVDLPPKSTRPPVALTYDVEIDGLRSKADAREPSADAVLRYRESPNGTWREASRCL